MVEFWRKFKKFLLLVFLAFIPTQLGRHFWPEWSYVFGIRIDYLSPVLYLIDLIWIGLFLLNFKKTIIDLKKIFNFKLLILVLFVAINVLIADNKWLSVYKWIRFSQVIWTIYYLIPIKNEIKKYLIGIIPLWIIGESFLGICQIFKGGSLNGVWYFLGERSFSFNTVGVAQMSIAGFGIVRAYGSFSHPNSLAGFLLLCLLIWVWLKPKIKNKIIWWLTIWFGVLGIIISGSRIVWGLGIIFWVLNWCYLKSKKRLIGVGLIVVGISILSLALISFNYPLKNFLGGWDKESFSKRMNLNISAIKMVKENFWMGNGLGNFINKLPEYKSKNDSLELQPVHNIPLLIVSEVGFLGLMILIWSILERFKDRKWRKIELFMLGTIIVTALWDHYWITLPQNLWLLTVVLAII